MKMLWCSPGSLPTTVNNLFIRTLLCWLALLGVFQSPAAPGDLDLSFDPAFGVNGHVTSIVPQLDGKILIAGEFTTVRGAARAGVARLNADGTVDRSFDPGLGANDAVSSIIQQTDGKLLVGGVFTRINGVNRNRIARLLTNGTLDVSFDPSSEMETFAAVNAIALQPDGKVLLGGILTNQVILSAPVQILRLNPNGTLDNTFNCPPITSGSHENYVSAIIPQPDDKLLIAGCFSAIDEIPRSGVARLNADGSVDTTFDPDSGASSSGVEHIAMQTDGKVILAGGFTSINGTNRNHVARLNTDGSLDLSFDPGAIEFNVKYVGSVSIGSLAVQADGKILIAGSFTNINGTNRAGVARLNSNGGLDGTFDPGANAAPAVSCVALQSDGRVLVGGTLHPPASFGDATPSHLLRLEANGVLDTTFVPGLLPTALAPNATTMALQPNGKVVLGFNSIFVDPFKWNWLSIARLNQDGTWDETFDPGSGPNGDVWNVALQSDGKVLVGGSFTQVNGTNRNRIARLQSNGALDTTFNPGANGSVCALAVQADGKVLMAGAFSTVGGLGRSRIARLETNGAVDLSFNPVASANGDVLSVVLQDDGKFLLCGKFTMINGTNRSYVARLHADGSLDTSFSPGIPWNGINPVFRSIAVQADGKILVAGKFTWGFNGNNHNGIVRVNGDGTLDATFNPGTGVNLNQIGFGSEGGVYSVAVQADGKVLLAGEFTSINGIARNRIARLNADGSLDTTFVPKPGPEGITGSGSSTVFSLALQPNGNVLVAGNFTAVNGVTRVNVARLHWVGAVLIWGPQRDNGELVSRFRGISAATYTLEYRDSLSSGTWQKLRNVTAPEIDLGLGEGVFELRDPIAGAATGYYRVVEPAY